MKPALLKESLTIFFCLNVKTKFVLMLLGKRDIENKNGLKMMTERLEIKEKLRVRDVELLDFSLFNLKTEYSGRTRDRRLKDGLWII